MVSVGAVLAVVAIGVGLRLTVGGGQSAEGPNATAPTAPTDSASAVVARCASGNYSGGSIDAILSPDQLAADPDVPTTPGEAATKFLVTPYFQMQMKRLGIEEARVAGSEPVTQDVTRFIVVDAPGQTVALIDVERKSEQGYLASNIEVCEP
ncbi:MAG TPA: hypothetical protein VEL76_34780 [Gemmataceae bacterium]|nr:hypothetical protein [Gemmataceae bacterium]